MASPFHYFRKHQKLFIAIAAGVAMFVFVLADPLMSWLQQSTNGAQSSPTATVVRWDGGTISARELDTLRQRRYLISNVLRQLQMRGAQRIFSEGGTPLQPTVPNFVLQENAQPRDIMESVVTTRILAELATQAGMTVSDEMINHYLREFSLRKVTDQEIAEVIQRTSRADLSYSTQQLFSGLRELLLSNHYMQSYSSATRNVMPEERWQDWRRINERISVEAALLPTEKFLSKTAEPTEKDLQELYNQFKDNLSGLPQIVSGVQLPSPNPGFREPQRVRLQYLLGDVNTWTQKLLDTVTDEEISDYYERNKRSQFVKTETQTTTSATEEAEEEPPKKEEAPQESEAKSEAKSEAEPEQEADEQSATKDEDSTAEEPTEKAETDEPAQEAAPAEQPATDASGSLEKVRPFRLTALLQSEKTEASEEKSAEENAADSKDANEEPEAKAKPEEETAAEEPETSKDTAEEETPKEEAPEEEYEPLKNVTDQIRRQLANDKAVVELKQVMERAYADLQSEYNRYGGALIEAKGDDRDPPPPPAKLANLGETATQSGLAYEETALLSQLELAETFVGKAVDSQSGRLPVVYAAFAKSEMQPYEPFLAQDLDGHWYLVIKVEDVPSRVPPMEEIRAQVVSAWKHREAAKLALQEAENLAKEAQETGETLAGFFAEKGLEVVTTDQFSWLTFGTTPSEMRRGPRLDEAPPLTAIGPDFMTKAFKLQAEQVTALLNHDQTSAYIIRLDRREKTEDELRQLFLIEANDWFGGQAMTSYRMQRVQQILLGQLKKRAGLDLPGMEEYLRPNDEP